MLRGRRIWHHARWTLEAMTQGHSRAPDRREGFRCLSDMGQEGVTPALRCSVGVGIPAVAQALMAFRSPLLCHAMLPPDQAQVTGTLSQRAQLRNHGNTRIPHRKTTKRLSFLDRSSTTSRRERARLRRSGMPKLASLCQAVD